MIHFQVSPPKVVKKPPTCGNEESVRPAYLTLGTFVQTPKIHFERVQHGQSKKRLLIIRNPTESNVWLKFTKRPSPRFQMSCPVDNVISANGQLDVEIVWTPTEAGTCFEAVQCQSSLSGIKLSIHLMGECIPAPKKAVAVRRRVLVKMADPSPTPRSASVPRANDPSLKSKTEALKSNMSMTLPRSPKLTHTRKSRLEAATAVAPPTGTGNSQESLSDETHNGIHDDTTMNLENVPPVDNLRENQVQEASHQQQSDVKIVASTPIARGSELDLMDKFAFPFTPETPRKGLPKPRIRKATTVIAKNSGNIAGIEKDIVIDDKLNTVRRETFVMDEEAQFQQDSAMASRRDTYLVPRAQENIEANLQPKKLDLVAVAESDKNDGESGYDASKGKSSPVVLNETIVYGQNYPVSLTSSATHVKVGMTNARDDSLLDQALDMTLSRLNSENDSERNSKPYQCQTEIISDSDSDSEDDEDRIMASSLAELQDLELQVKGFLARIPVR